MPEVAELPVVVGLGTGDVDIAAIVNNLHGYEGRYTLEQDTILTEEPRGEGLMHDVGISADHARSLLAGHAAAATEVTG